MTAPAATECTSLAALAEALDTARAATQAAAADRHRAQLSHDAEAERLRDQRAERKRVDADVSVAQLRATDAAIADAERQLGVTGAVLLRLERALSAAKKSEEGARRQLAGAERRVRGLPKVIRDIQVYLVTRRSELSDAERVARAIGAGIAEYEATMARLERELEELTG